MCIIDAEAILSEFFAGIGRGTIKFLSKNRIFIVTFFVAFSIMLAAFGVNQMYPVGDRQILVIDAWHQYYPFLSEFHNKIQSGGSLLYNHNIGLGVNFWLLSAYYTNSPLNWLSILVPSQYITEFMMVATAAKIAFAAMFMAMLLHWLYRRKDSFLLVFGLLYAFSTYFMGYYWCIMWLDSIMLLPLIILGLHKIIRGGREFLYIFSLAIAIISNYYIGYMICIFVAIYYVYLSLVYYKPKKCALALFTDAASGVFLAYRGRAFGICSDSYISWNAACKLRKIYISYQTCVRPGFCYGFEQDASCGEACRGGRLAEYRFGNSKPVHALPVF